MDEGDEARSLPRDRANKEGDSFVPGGIKGGQNEGDLGNLEMDPVCEQLCNARRVMVRMLSEMDRIGWRIANACDVLRICNGVYGLIAIGDIADGSQISERGLKRILSQYGLRLDSRKTGPPDCRTRALVPATRRDVSFPMEEEAKRPP
jgi:hypothetical protein